MHFTKRHSFDLEALVQIQGRTITPSPTVRILGVQLDSRLRWQAHFKEVRKKMETQMYALSRTTASTWGASTEKARHIYLAVVRPALSYGAALWHSPKEKALSGPAGKLVKYQNQGLRQVLGAFKATPIRQLETEAYVPPLDLWLNGRIARFQAQLERTGIARQINDACTAIRIQLRTQRQRRRAPPVTPAAKRRQWVEKWIGTPLEQLQGVHAKKLVLKDWRTRWEKAHR